MEIWKKFKEKYYVSNYGNVKNINTGRLLKQRKQHCGYMAVNLSINGKIKTYMVHRMVAIKFIPNPDNLPQVNHKDKNRANNYVDNLEWCTALYNAQYSFTFDDRYIISGIQHYAHKLTIQEIKELRSTYKPFSKIPNITKVAKYYGVSRATIHNVVDYKTYKNL